MPENRNPFNRGDIEYIAAQFLVRPVGVKKFRGGTANTSYLINSLSGKFVLTVLECHDELTARRLIDILVHVCHHGVCTGHPVETNKGGVLRDPPRATRHTQDLRSGEMQQSVPR